MLQTGHKVIKDYSSGKLVQAAKDGQQDTMHNNLCYTIAM